MASGFSLIELLVVIGVIGVLAGVLVTLINPATHLRRGRDTQRKSDLSRIQSALEIFRADLNAYPCLSPGAGCVGTIPACSLPLTGGTPSNTYMTQFPCDPLSPAYIYNTNAPSLSTYCLRACLENLTDAGRDEIKYGSNNPNNAATGCNFSNTQTCTDTVNRRSYTVQNP